MNATEQTEDVKPDRREVVKHLTLELRLGITEPT